MAKIYLESTDVDYLVANDNTTLVGTSGTDSVLIADGLTGVSVDSTIETVDLAGAMSEYTFQQGFGAAIDVYSGSDLVMSLSSVDGKQLTFTDGTVDLVSDASTVTLGGVLVAADAPAAVVGAVIDATNVSSVPTGGTTPVSTDPLVLTTIAAEAAYAELVIAADATAGEIAAAAALTLTTAEAAIAAGSTQALIDAEYDVLVADNAATLTLSNVIALDAANTAVANYLAAVDTDVVDPTTVDDDADSDATTDDTVASSGDVHAVYATAVTAYNAAVTGADVENDSATTTAALYSSELSSLNAALAVGEAAVTDAEAAVAAVTGLSDAITALDSATAADTAADAAAVVTQNTLDMAEAAYNVGNGATTVVINADGTISDDAMVAIAETTPGTAATEAVYTMTFGALVTGQSVTIGATTITATAAMTAIAVADAFEAAHTYTGFTGDATGTNATVVYTADAVGVVTDPTASTSGTETTNPGLAALVAANVADVAADAAAVITNTAMVAANTAVAALDPDTTAIANATAGFTITTPSATATAAQIDAEIAALDADLVAYEAIEALTGFTTNVVTTEGAFDTGVADLRAAIATAWTTGQAESETAVDLLLTNAVTAGFISAADATAIDTAYGVFTDHATTPAAADDDAMVAAAQTAVDNNNQIDELDALIADTFDGSGNALNATTAQTAITDFAVLADAVDAGSSPLAATLSAADDAVYDDQGTTTTTDDTGLQVDVADLVAAKADYDALVTIDDALTALEATVTTIDALVDDITLVTSPGTPTTVAATTADEVVMISNLVAGDDATVTSFSATDSIYFGDDFTVNAGALTTGDNSVLEMFITAGTTAADSLITFETAVFGSASEGDFFTVELTGVAVDEITIVDGMIIGA